MIEAQSGKRDGEHLDEPVWLALADRDDVVARVRQLLEAITRLCIDSLKPLLTASLDDIENQLFSRAEQSRSNEEQQSYFESLREIKRGRADIIPRFLQAMEHAIARFDQPRKLPPRPTRPRPGLSLMQEFSLVDTSELEKSLALQEFTARAEIRHAAALYALGYRFGVMAGMPEFDVEGLPIGPARIADALRHACAGLEINPDHRILLYHTFDRLGSNVVGSLYADINRYLADEHILSNLHNLAPRAKDIVARRARSSPSRGEPARPAENQPPVTLGLPPDPVQATSADTHATGMPDANATDPGDRQLFDSLRRLLEEQRHTPAEQAAPGRTYVPSSEDIQSMLRILQSRPAAPIMLDGKLVQRSVAHLKQDLLAQLRQVVPDGSAPRLADEDSDTIDLVGMLFDYLLKQIRPDGSTRALMTKLQVPLLRVALRDKSFFAQRNHPARQLLNTVAETGVQWLDDNDGPTDGNLVDKLQLLMDRLSQEFDGDLELIENVLTTLSQHLRTLARKAEVTERRHVDAVRGREKLTLARERASEAVRTRIAGSRPNKLVRTILEQAWTDVLALTLLRQGERSDAYRKRLAVADQLLALRADQRGNPRAVNALRQEIETALDQVGYHRDDIQAVTSRLFDTEPAGTGTDPGSNTEIAIKLKSKPRLGGTGAAGATTPAPLRKPEIKPGSAEAEVLEQIKALPFGTWFAFNVNQQGDHVRRKLAWFSTVTGRCLFVNQRGVRCDERTLQQLACDMVKGQASVVAPDDEAVVDRAWKAVMNSLKHIVGNDPAAAGI